jgi:hypothetical protein
MRSYRLVFLDKQGRLVANVGVDCLVREIVRIRGSYLRILDLDITDR